MEEKLAAYVEASEITVPEELFEEAVEQLTTEIFHKKRYEYMAQGRILTPYDVAGFADEIRDSARAQVKTKLVLEDVIQKEAFEVSSEELEEEIKAIAKRLDLTEEAVREFMGEEMFSLKEDILFNKAIAFITA